MKKVINAFGYLVVTLAFLCGYGYAVKESVNGNSSGKFAQRLNEFVSFPKTVIEVFSSKEIRNIPPTFEAKLITDTFNHLAQDVYGLLSLYDRENDNWNIVLMNFRDNTTTYKWKLVKENFNQTDRQWANSEPRNPILLPNRGLITDNDETFNLYRLDSASNIVWHNKQKKFHHSMNLDHEGNIWVCTTELRRIRIPQEDAAVPYEDDHITRVDVKTGEILWDKSTSDIFIENGFRDYVYGFANGTHDRLEQDPLHLNDIEPILEDGPYWKQGDVLLSFRNRSAILLYRPSTNKILRLIHGPFLKQHDVDVINDSTISFFNNEGTNVGSTIIPEWEWDRLPVTDTISHSNIMEYNFADSTFAIRFKNHFDHYQIYSMYQGFHHYLSDSTVYVEDHTGGSMYFMNDAEVIYKKQMPNQLDTLVENPHWTRIYENVDF